jgi:signal transduction histidine kinase
LYCELSDSLFSEDIAQKFAEQQIKYETEKKEAEIKILKQQEEINSLQIQEQEILLQKRKYLLFASLLVITSLFVVGYFYFSRQKIRAQQQQYLAVKESEENERLRIAKDIHDDLGSGLSKIKFLTELVASKSENNPEIKSSIKSISETATFLVENMRDLIWALNPENSTLGSLIARIREYSSDYLNDFPIELSFSISDEIPNCKITKEAHRNIFFIVKESLQNIIKHANASIVQLTIDIIDHKLKMTITDNGKGLAKEDNKNGNGLKNIMQRATVINSLVKFNSQQGNGTSISIITPIKNIEKP